MTRFILFIACLSSATSLSAQVNSRPKQLTEGAKAGEKWRDNILQMEFCWCRPGTFRMGSPADEKNRSSDEEQVDVTLTEGFWMGSYEVTQAQYQRFMVHNPSRYSRFGLYRGRVINLSTSELPVESVTWEEAMDFCRKFTNHEQQAGRLPMNWKYTLPTEAQWEYACRAGTTSATYYGDSLSSSQANFNGQYPYNGAPEGVGLRRPTMVGHYQSNFWGLYDMHGNVMEWCRDSYQKKYSGDDDPLISTNTDQRVARGGSWIHAGFYSRSAKRMAVGKLSRHATLGFRVAIVRTNEAAK